MRRVAPPPCMRDGPVLASVPSMAPPLDGELEALGRVIVATLLALPAGWERERHRRPAGLRTHMLVGAGTAAFVVIGELFGVSYAGNDVVEVDPARTIQAVAVGVGFLGAGTIFLAGGRVRGLTTAASIWATSAIGAAAGGGYFVL